MNDHTIKLAKRMAYIEPFHVMDLLAMARSMEAEGKQIVHMEIGEPDFVTPEPVIRAAQTALQQGLTHYTPAVGLTALRERIAGYYQERFNANVNPEQIIITPGASGALLLALGVLINTGDKVAMSDPGYPCNRHFVRLFDGDPVGVPVSARSRYQLTVDLLEQAEQSPITAVMLASPSNPTGTLLTRAEMGQWMKYAEKRHCYLLMDEIYQGLVYGEDSATIAGQCSHAFIINSFSKYFCMTGWRLGWLVVPPGYQREVDKLAQNIFLAPSTLAQYAAVAAFDSDSISILESQRQQFQQRRDFLKQAIQELGFQLLVEPQGAFYLYADCSRFTNDSFEFCQSLLKQAGVAIAPGKDFGAHESHRYVRFAYTTSMEQLEQGVEKIRVFLAGA
ncbi:MAG: pyridoxal phosphate-dependent aminotransferase [Gammaproteobacteria bacterium]|nr:pyridoxal phosphate-dependent aminotransferase [Gammaproteobacteria bacterium]